MVAVTHCTAPGISLEGGSIWNVPRVQGGIFHSSEHIDVGGGNDVLSEITVLGDQGPDA